jgi:hypothetical protein
MSSSIKLQGPLEITDDDTPEWSIRAWGTTRAERALAFSIDDQFGPEGQSLFRGVTIRRSADVVWKWLGQLRLGPYSYDWLDNGFRRSPQRLLDLPEMSAGDLLWVWPRIVEVDPHRSMTAVCRSYGDLRPRKRLFHKMMQKPGYLLFDLDWVGLTYQIREIGPKETRLLVKLRWKCRNNVFAPLGYLLFALADFIMMRRQLLNLKELAERSHEPARPHSPPTR